MRSVLTWDCYMVQKVCAGLKIVAEQKTDNVWKCVVNSIVIQYHFSYVGFWLL